MQLNREREGLSLATGSNVCTYLPLIISLIWSITRSVNSELRALEKLVASGRSSLKWEVALKTFVDTSIHETSGCNWRQMLIKSPGCARSWETPQPCRQHDAVESALVAGVGGWGGRRGGGHSQGPAFSPQSTSLPNCRSSFLISLCQVHYRDNERILSNASSLLSKLSLSDSIAINNSDLVSFPEFFQSWYSLRQDSE